TLGTIGTGLLTNFVQKVFDKGLSPAELEKLARADPDIQRVVDAIVAATGSVEAARTELATKQDSFLSDLENDLRLLAFSPQTQLILQGNAYSDVRNTATVTVNVGPGSTVNFNGGVLGDFGG